MHKNLFIFSNSFWLEILPQKTNTQFVLQMRIKSVNTRDYPITLNFLKENLPSVLKTQCFNENKYNFRQEVKATEIGHLFEHILLDRICKEKLSRGFNNIVFNGNTSWNWEKEPKGVFHITIDSGEKDFKYLKTALKTTISIMEELLLSKEESVEIPLDTSYINNLNNFIPTDKASAWPVESA